MVAEQARVNRRLLVEAGLAAAVLMVALVVGYRELRQNFRVAHAVEDLTVACTGKPGWIPIQSLLYQRPEWVALMEGKADSFPCEAAADLFLVQVGTTWQLQEYFHRALGAWFQVVGPRVIGFITFQAAMFGLTCTVAYLIFRLAFSRLLALAGAAAIMLSTSHLSMAGLLIEYTKAPWILAAVLLCAVIVRYDAVDKHLYWSSIGLGLVSGIGIGFKPDVLAVLPLAVATPLLFVRAVGARSWSRRMIASALVALGILLAGGPMLYRNFFATTGSLLPVQLLGGQDFETEALYAITPLYDYGLIYNDSHITWLINSYGQRVLGMTVVSAFYGREMQEMASSLLIALWTTFPADLMLRVIAGTIRVLQLNGLPVVISIAGLFVIFARSRREGWFVAMVIVYLSAYVSLVFQRRHFFHLEFISWFLLGAVLSAVLAGAVATVRALAARRVPELITSLQIQRQPAMRAVLAMGVIAAGGTLALLGVRAYQQRTVTGLVERYQATPRQSRPFTIGQNDDDHVTVRAAALSLQDRPAPDPSVLPPAADYLVLTFRCRDERTIGVRMKYLAPLEDWSNWNRHFDVICAGAGTESTMMLPVYQYAPAYVLDGLVMSGEDAAALESVSTMRADSSIALWLNLLIPGDWRDRSWYELLKLPPTMPI